MLKIVVQEFDVCHKFVQEIRHYIASDQISKCTITHNVSCGEFSIFIGFASGHCDIDALIFKITKKAKESDLYQNKWKVHRALIQRGKYMKLLPDASEHEVVIAFAVVFKKMACFWPLHEKYKRLLQGKKYILDLKRTDSRTVIEVICNEKDMYVEKQLFTLNELYKKFDALNYGFDDFFVTEIISAK